MKKRIAVIGPAYPYRGGIAHFSNHLSYFLNLEKDVKAKIFNYRILYPKIFFPGKTQYDLSKNYFKIETERILSPFNPFTWRSTYKKIIKEGYRIVVIQWWHPFLSIPLYYICRSLKRKNVQKLVFICHNYSSHEMGWFWSFFTKPTLRQADILIALSSFVAKKIVKELPASKLCKIRHPVYTIFMAKNEISIKECRQKIGLSVDEKIILFFGYIRAYKGLSDLLNALPAAIAKIPNLRLLIAGEFYESIDKYIRQIEEINISNNVTIIDRYIPNEMVYYYFRAADVIVLPYRTASQSGIIPQAHKFNLPVITTNVGGLADEVIFEAGDRLIPPKNVKALASGIIDFFSKETAVKNPCSEINSVKKSWEKFIEVLTSDSS